jgi:hypothetical protein
MTKVLSQQVIHLQMMMSLKIIMEALMPDAINDSKIKANPLKTFKSNKWSITIANNQLTKENYQLAIYDIFGSIVLQLVIQRAKFQIVTDVSSFSNGFYFVELSKTKAHGEGNF